MVKSDFGRINSLNFNKIREDVVKTLIKTSNLSAKTRMRPSLNTKSQSSDGMAKEFSQDVDRKLKQK